MVDNNGRVFDARNLRKSVIGEKILYENYHLSLREAYTTLVRWLQGLPKEDRIPDNSCIPREAREGSCRTREAWELYLKVLRWLQELPE